MIGWMPTGAAVARFLSRQSSERPAPPSFDPDDLEPHYFGWEIARCAAGLDDESRRAVALLAAACLASMRSGSTRLPLAAVLAGLSGEGAVPAVRQLVARARAGGPGDPIAAVIGSPGERRPLIIDGDWLYAERMLALEERFCARIRERLARTAPRLDPRALARAVSAAAAGPPALTDQQKRAVRECLSSGLSLVTGGPGSGKTTTAIGLIRALTWLGVPMDTVAIAAPTGRAAQRLAESLARAFAAAPRDFAEAGLRAISSAPQTLHRLLGWSPSSGRFARHENDPLASRVVIVDEASMVDLALMDRLVRALKDDARLVLFGDADQLPSVEAGAAFRDLCASVGATQLSANLRVAREANAARLVDAARAINGAAEADLFAAVAARTSVEQVAFDGAEFVALPWPDCGGALLETWWSRFVVDDSTFARRVARTYRARDGTFDEEDAVELRALHAHFARARILCATRGSGLPSGAESINERLLAMLRGDLSLRRVWRGRSELLPGAPVLVQRNDYERGLYNGDQGVIVRVDPNDGGGARPMAVFARQQSFDLVALDARADIAPAFALTVHKAQGSEFDHVAFVLPEADLPMLTRELVYTAVTRARRSALIVGARDLLTRAVSRTVMRSSGVAERLERLSA